MLDFTSALYLGLRHPSGSLRPWSQFTTGVPAALASPLDAEQVARQLATLQGCEYGVLGTSTFHLFWDLFGMLSRCGVAVYVDGGTYPIARWGVERAAARGVPVHEFAHHDPEALWRQLWRDRQAQLRPVVLTDSFCPACGKPAPLRSYLYSVRAFGGWLVMDDTQPLGIFGYSQGAGFPYGRGGGGMLPRIQIGGPDVLVISSLAKAFGAPVAILSGSKRIVKEFELKSETRMHCSPPSFPVILAAQHALAVNREHGDRLRLRLAGLVAQFRRCAAQAALQFAGELFPVETLAPLPEIDTLRLHQRLLQRGIRTVLHYAGDGNGLRISFLITARHSPEVIDRAGEILADSAGMAYDITVGGDNNGFS
jgi:8-amino-7-oxononanoate synthase